MGLLAAVNVNLVSNYNERGVFIIEKLNAEASPERVLIYCRARVNEWLSRDAVTVLILIDRDTS